MNMQTLRDWRRHWAQQARDSALRQRWQQLQARERLALSMLAIFLLTTLLYLALWQPASRQLQSAHSYYESQLALHQYLLEHAEQARQVAGQHAMQPLLAEQLSGAITQSAEQHALLLERVNSQGEAGLQVSLSQASFEALLRWLLELQSQGVELTEISLARQDDGKVNATLGLKAAN